MFEFRAFCILFSCIWYNLAIFWFTTFAAYPIAKPDCNTTCGNLTVPYPFGIGLNGACSLSGFYNINCNDPLKPLLARGNLEIVDISINGRLRFKSNVASRYYNNGEIVPSMNENYASTSLNKFPMVFSDTANKLTVIGCDDYAYIRGTLGQTYRSGCIVGCSKPTDIINGSCSGIGCCETPIPKGLKNFGISLYSFSNHINVSSFNPYGYAFLAEQDTFSFNVADLNDPTFENRTQEHVPVVLEWFVGINQTCRQAKRNQSSYACQNNTNCTDFDTISTRGYRCNCLPGYEGNPYLSPGCTDIDECATNSGNQCSDKCINTPGSYKCFCPKGHRGDGLKNGKGCISNSSQFVMRLALGLSLGFLSSLMLLSWTCFTMVRRKNIMKMREKYFEQNGGRLLKQQLCQNGQTVESSKIFSAEELKIATNNQGRNYYRVNDVN